MACFCIAQDSLYLWTCLLRLLLHLQCHVKTLLWRLRQGSGQTAQVTLVFPPVFNTHTHTPLPSSQIQGLLARWGQGLGDSPKTYEAAEQPYSQALEPLAVGVFDADAPGAYNSHFKTMANQQEGECHRHRSYPGTRA